MAKVGNVEYLELGGGGGGDNTIISSVRKRRTREQQAATRTEQDTTGQNKTGYDRTANHST